jgi:hypothetical protein
MERGQGVQNARKPRGHQDFREISVSEALISRMHDESGGLPGFVHPGESIARPDRLHNQPKPLVGPLSALRQC